MSKNAKLALPVDMRRSRVVLVKLPIFTNVTWCSCDMSRLQKVSQPARKLSTNGKDKGASLHPLLAQPKSPTERTYLRANTRLHDGTKRAGDFLSS